jgi:DNA-binding NtrC family response regulator
VPSSQPIVLVCDDEKNIRRTLEMVLGGEGIRVLKAESAEEMLKTLAHTDVDLVVLDVKLPGMTGVEALAQIRKDEDLADLPVLMLSGHATVQDAVDAVRLGATDFFEKPIDRERVLIAVKNALAHGRIARELRHLRAEVASRYEMIGDSPAAKRIYREIEKVAPTKGRVLITGESGTGKELVARAIHRLSPRASGPFIKVNCAAIPAELIESELFGYERGAFTGATGRKKGQFELADDGTIFLDEIGDMSASAQAKVLRALQSGEITRVGSESVVSVDVRVLAATNKDLAEEVKAGRFREDLYFRLNVVPIHVPALRDRREDIPLLFEAFGREYCRENGISPKPVRPGVVARLNAYAWPGNVRELRNLVERLLILSGAEITEDDLPEDLVAPGEAPASVTPGERMTLRAYKETMERAYILEVLRENDWNVSRAAIVLGIERTNLHKKMRGYGIQRES